MRPELIIDHNKYTLAFYIENREYFLKDGILMHVFLHKPEQKNFFYVWSFGENEKLLLSSGKLNSIELGMLYALGKLNLEPNSWESYQTQNTGPMYPKPSNPEIRKNRKANKAFIKLISKYNSWK